MSGENIQERINYLILFIVLFAVTVFYMLIGGKEAFRESPYTVFESIHGEPGQQISFVVSEDEVEGIRFNMRFAPGGKFPVGINDGGMAIVNDEFLVAETELTYKLWYKIRIWAERKGYNFANLGREGSSSNVGGPPANNSNLPVTSISWFDAVIWCNALSELKELEPIYTYKGEVYKNALNENEGIFVEQKDGIGFRLLTKDEWELAARYKDGRSWTPGSHASGSRRPAYPPPDSRAPDSVAWYKLNSGGRAHAVGQKEPNDLGLYDMSGNVGNWCFCWRDDIKDRRVNRGSTWKAYPVWLRIGFSRTNQASYTENDIGFRLAKNVRRDEEQH